MPSSDCPVNLTKQPIALKSNINLIYNSEDSFWNNFTLKFCAQMIRDDTFMNL